MEGRIRTGQGVFLWLEGISLTVSMVGIVPLQLPKLVPPPLAASMMSLWSLVLPVANFNEHVMWQAVKSQDLVHLEAICLHLCVKGKGDVLNGHTCTDTHTQLIRVYG